MSTVPLITQRFARQVELVFRNTNPTAFAFQVGTADTLDEAFAGTHAMFTIPRLGTYQSPTIRRRRLGNTQYHNRNMARALYDPQDFWTTVNATATAIVNNVLAAGDTLTINGNALTGVAVARTPGANDFQANLANPGLIAAEIEAAVNDPLNAFATDVTANAVGATVTLTAVVPGVAGNALTLATLTVPAGGITISGATFTGGYTMPADANISFLRVSEVLADGTVLSEGPILVVPPPAWCTSPRPVLTLSGTAPSVVGQPNGLPPVGALHIVFPRFSDNLTITNLQGAGGTSLAISCGIGLPEVTVKANSVVTFYDAVCSDLFLRGISGTASFSIHAALVQGEMA